MPVLKFLAFFGLTTLASKTSAVRNIETIYGSELSKVRSELNVSQRMATNFESARNSSNAQLLALWREAAPWLPASVITRWSAHLGAPE
jgi:hypothetical protein